MSNTPPDGLRELRIALEPVAMPPQRGAAWPSSFRPSTKRESIAAVVAELPRDIVDRVIVADGGSTDGTQDARATPAPR